MNDPKPVVIPKITDENTSSEDDNAPVSLPTEYGGVNGPEPTRYGDWERNGRCTDF